MGFGRFLLKRSANMVIVLFFVVFLTLVLVGPAMDNIIKRSILVNVTEEITNNRALVGSFKDPKELENYKKNLIEVRSKALGLDQPW